MKEKILKAVRNKKNLKVFGIAALVTLIVLSSFSYAYFIGSIGGSASTDVDVTTGINERLIFNEGTPIGIHATLDNFYEGAGSLRGSTTSTARLNASSGSTATELYQVYFDIGLNDFEYSKDENTPELILTVTDPEGNVITTAKKEDGTVINTKSVTTLVQDENGNPVSKTVVGFDVTDYVGFIHIYEDYTITNNSPSVPTIQEWDAEITFINLDTEQTVNEGKSFSADLILQQDKMNQVSLVTNMMMSGPDFAAVTNDFRMDMTDPQNPVMPSKELHKIVFNSTINETAYNAATDKWDVSALNDGSVVAYMVNDNSVETMYIEANGKVISHPDQSNLFVDMENMIILGTNLFWGLGSLGEIDFNNSFDTSKVEDMSYMFALLFNITTLDVSSLDTSNVKKMSHIFSYSPFESIDISNWNTSNVIDMSNMFSGVENLSSLLLDSIDTSKVEDMSYMFSEVKSLTTLDLSHFNTSNVTDMSFMFHDMEALTTLDISNFNTSNVTDMSYMYSKVRSLTTLDISTFDTSEVTTMSNMFSYMHSLTTLDLSNFNTSKVTDMENMFSVLNNLISLNVSSFDTSNVVNMSNMFTGVSSLTNLNISNFDTSKVTTMYRMFERMSSLTVLDINNFDTAKVTNMNSMFREMVSLTIININNFNTSSVTDMGGMFYALRSLTTLDISHFNTSNITYMSHMFYDMRSLITLDISSFNTSKVTDMSGMFSGIELMTSLNVSHFNTSNVTNMEFMFYNMNSLITLDISSFDTSQVTSMNGIFNHTNNLTEPLYAKTQADVDKFNNRATTALHSGVSFTVKP